MWQNTTQDSDVLCRACHIPHTLAKNSKFYSQCFSRMRYADTKDIFSDTIKYVFRNNYEAYLNIKPNKSNETKHSKLNNIIRASKQDSEHEPKR